MKTKRTTVIQLDTFFTSNVDGECPQDWEDKGHFCYLMNIDLHISYNQASEECKKHNATLASINSTEEQDYIFAFYNGK